MPDDSYKSFIRFVRVSSHGFVEPVAAALNEPGAL